MERPLAADAVNRFLSREADDILSKCDYDPVRDGAFNDEAFARGEYAFTAALGEAIAHLDDEELGPRKIAHALSILPKRPNAKIFDAFLALRTLEHVRNLLRRCIPPEESPQGQPRVTQQMTIYNYPDEQIEQMVDDASSGILEGFTAFQPEPFYSNNRALFRPILESCSVRMEPLHGLMMTDKRTFEEFNGESPDNVQRDVSKMGYYGLRSKAYGEGGDEVEAA